MYLALLPLLAGCVWITSDERAEWDDHDRDGFQWSADCDDEDPAVNPAAEEICDGIDNDCDDEVDEGVVPTWYIDYDDDGWGDETYTEQACEGPSGYVDQAGDCDDHDASVNPGAAESCANAGVDDDCDGEVDEDDAEDITTWYEDSDGDGYGNAEVGQVGCTAPSGYLDDDTDCDDGDADIHPGAAEICGDGIDNDCDGGAGTCDGPYGETRLDEVEIRFSGANEDDRLGYASSLQQNFDADDYTDLVVSAPYADGDEEDAGAVYVVYGPITGGLDLSPDSDVAVVLGAAGWDNAGIAISAGDMMGSAVEDLVIGAPRTGPYAENCGAVYVFASLPVGEQTTDDADTSFLGSDDSVDAGQSVAALGDTTGDGTADLVIGGPSAGEGGAAWLFTEVSYGDFAVSEAQWTVESGSGAELGAAVASLGDLDGDGLADLAVGAPDYAGSGDQRGAAGVFLGPPPTGTGTLEDADLLVVGQDDYDNLGASLAGPGDIDGDGNDDLLVGAPDTDESGDDAGSAYLFLGPLTGTVGASSAHAAMHGEADHDSAGYSVSGAGDINADTWPDLVVGAPYHDLDETHSSSGAAYLVLGPVTGTVDLAEAHARFLGTDGGHYAGFSVSGGGDATGDRVDDLIVGVPYHDAEAADSGSLYLVPGGAGL